MAESKDVYTVSHLRSGQFRKAALGGPRRMLTSKQTLRRVRALGSRSAARPAIAPIARPVFGIEETTGPAHKPIEIWFAEGVQAGQSNRMTRRFSIRPVTVKRFWFDTKRLGP
jgi:hypothetical protein